MFKTFGEHPGLKGCKVGWGSVKFTQSQRRKKTPICYWGYRHDPCMTSKPYGVVVETEGMRKRRNFICATAAASVQCQGPRRRSHLCYLETQGGIVGRWHFCWILQNEWEWSNSSENSEQYYFSFLKGSQTKLGKKEIGFLGGRYSMNEVRNTAGFLGCGERYQGTWLRSGQPSLQSQKY